VQETSRTENSTRIAHEQSRHFANTSSTYPQQQQPQQKCVVMTTMSTSERTHHHTLTSVAMSSHHPTAVERLTSQPGLTLMMSRAASRPQLLPVPVARKSFRIDDILGEERARRDDMQGRPRTTTETCMSSTPTDCQASRQSSDRLTERPPTDISQLHHQQKQQWQQHQSSETNERAGHVDAVVVRRRSSSPVTKRSRDSNPDFSFRRRHVMSGGQSSGTSQSSQDSVARPADLYVNAVRPIQLRQSGVDQDVRLSPSSVMLASHSPCLRRHHRPYQQQQQFGQVAENAAVAVFGTHHHPLLLVPPQPPPSSTLHCVDSLNTFFAGRHSSFLPGCEFFRFVHSKTKL